jgi:hypothetical protein
MGQGVQEEEGVVMLAVHADVGFVAGGGVAERGFVSEIEVVTVVSSGLGIVENGLVTEGHAEDLAEDLSGFASGKSEGDVKG